MEETYRIKAIVLDRKDFRENDLLVTVFSLERGRESLVARGAKKFRSKLAAHLEPFCLIEGLVVRGKNIDYLGSALSVECFAAIKNDLDKIKYASLGIIFFKKIVLERFVDKQLFDLLLEFFVQLNLAKTEEAKKIYLLFAIKLKYFLGVGLDANNCSICDYKLISNSNVFNSKSLSFVHKNCSEDGLTISDNCIKVFRTVNVLSFEKSVKILLTEDVLTELENITKQQN